MSKRFNVYVFSDCLSAILAQLIADIPLIDPDRNRAAPDDDR